MRKGFRPPRRSYQEIDYDVDLSPIRELLDRDVVIAIWPLDERGPHEVTSMMIKGHDLCHSVLATGEAQKAAVAWVRCRSSEDVEALRKLVS